MACSFIAFTPNEHSIQEVIDQEHQHRCDTDSSLDHTDVVSKTGKWISLRNKLHCNCFYMAFRVIFDRFVVHIQ
jgi:hypothetical protein